MLNDTNATNMALLHLSDVIIMESTDNIDVTLLKRQQELNKDEWGDKEKGRERDELEREKT